MLFRSVPSATAADGAGISMLSSTMRAVGNDGAHYNTDINAGNNTYFPGDLARSNALSDDLVIASDHIPQILEFTVPAKLSAAFASTRWKLIVASPTAMPHFETRARFSITPSACRNIQSSKSTLQRDSPTFSAKA